MQNQDLIENVEKLSQTIVEEIGCEIVDVEYVREGSTWVLRLYIDKVGGVGIEDCQAVSHLVGAKLDEMDIVKQAYCLEVSSPGERPLKNQRDFDRYKGQDVEVKLFKAIEGKKLFAGKLKCLTDGNIFIIDEGNNEIIFEKSKVALVKRVIKL